MKRLILLAAVVAFFVWRGRTLDRYDREHAHGAYARVSPTTTA